MLKLRSQAQKFTINLRKQKYKRIIEQKRKELLQQINNNYLQYFQIEEIKNFYKDIEKTIVQKITQNDFDLFEIINTLRERISRKGTPYEYYDIFSQTKIFDLLQHILMEKQEEIYEDIVIEIFWIYSNVVLSKKSQIFVKKGIFKSYKYYLENYENQQHILEDVVWGISNLIYYQENFEAFQQQNMWKILFESFDKNKKFTQISQIFFNFFACYFYQITNENNKNVTQYILQQVSKFDKIFVDKEDGFQTTLETLISYLEKKENRQQKLQELEKYAIIEKVVEFYKYSNNQNNKYMFQFLFYISKNSSFDIYFDDYVIDKIFYNYQQDPDTCANILQNITKNNQNITMFISKSDDKLMTLYQRYLTWSSQQEIHSLLIIFSGIIKVSQFDQDFFFDLVSSNGKNLLLTLLSKIQQNLPPEILCKLLVNVANIIEYVCQNDTKELHNIMDVIDQDNLSEILFISLEKMENHLKTTDVKILDHQEKDVLLYFIQFMKSL